LRDLLLEWKQRQREQQQQQQQQQPQTPVEELAEAASLRRNLDAYAWLNKQLRGLRVSPGATCLTHSCQWLPQMQIGRSAHVVAALQEMLWLSMQCLHHAIKGCHQGA
jgi:hypothetical protein